MTAVPETDTSAPGLNQTGNPLTLTEACVVTGAIERRLTVPVVVPAIVTVTVVGFMIQTACAVPVVTPVVVKSPGIPEIDTVPDTKAEPVKLTTVVPAPAVTVPVITMGNAVVDWPPAIQITCPVAEIDGAVVISGPAFKIVTVPLTTALTDAPC